MAHSAPSWWAARNLKAACLLPLSFLFSTVSALRRLAWRCGIFKAQRIPVPVIVVGNVAAGGSGKTPVVIWLVEALRRKGFTPGIVSRGYGGTAIAPRAVRSGDSPNDTGDEPLLLVARTAAPMWIGRKRAEVALALLAANPEVNVIVTDDGLQHYALDRDVEIVVLDENVLGNGWPLPAGPLREPLSRVRKAHLAILHGELSRHTHAAIGAVPTATMSLRPAALYRLQEPTDVVDVDVFQGMRLKAVAGIGRPERFFETLRGTGLSLADTRAFPDHHQFASQDFSEFRNDIVMTEKDAVKCQSFAKDNWYSLIVGARLSESFWSRFQAKLVSHSDKRLNV